MKANLLQFFSDHQLNMKAKYFHLFREDQTEMLEKFAAKIPRNEALNCPGPPQAKRRRQIRATLQMQTENLATNSENPTGTEEVPFPASVSVVDQPHSSKFVEKINREESSPLQKEHLESVGI